MSYFHQLGVLGYPLLICSSLILAIIIERTVFFLITFPLPNILIEQILHSEEAAISKDTSNQLSKNRFGMIILELLAKRNLPNDERESYFSMQLLQSEQALFRYLPLLKILATVSPLLGLLGTVLGMINAFELISTIDKPITPSLVAGGISQALITTAAGLMIAIPALIAHSLFQMRINRLIQQFTRQLNIVNLHIQNSSRTVN